VPDGYYKPDSPLDLQDRKANASFVMLVRNSDLSGIMSSMKQIEDRFNRKFQYPYVFLNDEPFTQSFKECVFLTFRSLKLLTCPIVTYRP
jgi:alpha 1,2-mannosyltransferase